MVDPARDGFGSQPSPSLESPTTWRDPPPAAPEPPVRSSGLPRRVDRLAEVRLDLQRRAPANLRLAVRRAVVRFSALLLADLAAFAVMRSLVRAVRDRGVAGSWLGHEVSAIIPAGHLNGWEFAVALVLGLLVTGNYGQGDRRRDPGRLFFACALAAGLPLWSAIWTDGVESIFLQYAVTTLFVWVGIVADRLTIDRLIALVRTPGTDAADTLFVGGAADCRRLAGTPAFAGRSEYRAIGFVDVHNPPAAGALGHIGDFPLLLAASGVQAVVVCGELPDAQFQEVVDVTLAAGCQLLSVPGALGRAGVQPSVVWRDGQALVQLTTPSLKGQHLILKRLMDVVGAAVGLLLAAPLILVLAVIIKLDSRGSVFFRQERIGIGGRRFKIVKLRTMVDGAEAHRGELMSQSVYRDPRLFKVLSDPRTTRVGRWLRRTSLDELPQLVNVLRGDMSLVGPRPPLLSEVALYEAHHYARFDVKPGITGPWQVAGRNRVTDFERVVTLETEYIRNWSLGRDVAVLLSTIPAVLGRRGAH